MARPTKKVIQQRETKVAILLALERNGIDQKYLLDQVDEYMLYFENLYEINSQLRKGFDVDLSKEKRQITKEMRSILSFLGLKPELNLNIVADEFEAL